MSIKTYSKHISFIVIYVFIFASTVFPQGQNPIFDHLNVKNGLSNNLVFEMTQDSLGFVWIATQDGLNRYDGYQVKVFRGDDSIKTVPDSWISCITTDKNNNIWYGTRTAGVGKIDSKTGEFISFKNILEDKFGKNALNIQTLHITSNDNIMIGTWGAGLLIYNPSDSTFTQYLRNENSNNTLSENRIYAVYEDSKGNYWAGSHRTGLNKIDKENGKITHFNFVGNNQKSVSNNFVLSVCEDYKGDIWVGTYSNGLYKIKNGVGKVIKYDSTKNMTGKRVSKILEDSKNNLWISTNGSGIFKYKRDEDNFINFRHDPMKITGLNTDKIWSIMEDHEGMIWFGTISSGINIYDPTKNKFKRLIHRENDKNSIISSYVKSILIDKNDNKWIGTSNGISIISKSGATKHLTTDQGLSANSIRALHKRENGEIWIGTWGGGVNIYNPRSGQIKYLMNDPENENSLADNYLKCILEYDDKVYIGTERGLNQYNLVNDRIKLFIPEDEILNSEITFQITVLYIDSNENFWVGSNRGLYTFDIESETFRKIEIDKANENPQRIRIREVFEDSNNNIWIGTLGAGFAKYNSQDHSFDFITEEEGLSNNSVYEILEDENERFWISTNSGLNQFDPKTGKFFVYKESDGLTNNEFNGGASFKDSDGTMYFGGVKGLTYFDPSSISIDKTKPSIAISNITVNGVEFNTNSFYKSLKSIELPHDQNYINITFTALSFQDPGENKFKYMLKGLNDKWINSESGNTAVFTDLDNGEYEFHVKGANKFGIWNEEGRKLTIIINPPWWDTIYAQVIYFIAFVSIIYGIFKLRMKKISERQLLLEKLVSERTEDLNKSKIELEKAVAEKDKLFSIIAHDLKSPFTAILGYSQMMASSNNELSEKEMVESSKHIYNASRSIFSLLQNLLDWARLQLNNVDYSREKLNVYNVVDEILRIYSISASMKSISVNNNIDKNLFIYADEKMLETILRNFISNAIKFTNSDGTVTISSQNKSNTADIIIEDNGVGMDEKTLERIRNNGGSQYSTIGTSDEEGTGLGIMLAKEFIQKNNGNLKIDSAEGKGTKITVSFQVDAN